jgi:hypothetical protein
MSPKDGMTVEKVSLAVLAVLGVVGLAYFIATTLEVLPIISASWMAPPTVLAKRRPAATLGGSGTLTISQPGEFLDGGERDEQHDYHAAGAVDV